MGNSASDRFPVRHGNHDVHRQSLKSAGCVSACASRLHALSPHEDPRAGLRRRRRLPAVELQLPQLRRPAQGHAARPAAHAILDRRVRQQTMTRVGAGQRFAGHPGPAAGESRSAAGPRAARHRHRRHRPGRRPGRSHHRAVHAARIESAMADLVHGQHLRRSHPRQSRCSACSRTTAASTGTASISTARTSRSTASTGVRWRALPVASKPAPYSPNRESPVPGDNIALVHHGRSHRSNCALCAGAGAIDRARLARDGSRLLACSWTARSGPTTK